MAINWTEAQIEQIVASVMKNLGHGAPDADCQWDSKSYCGRSLIPRKRDSTSMENPLFGLQRNMVLPEE